MPSVLIVLFILRDEGRPDADPRPYDTGDELWGKSSHYKQLAAAVGDAFFHAFRRLLQQAYRANGFQDQWSYRFEVSAPLGLQKFLGVFHAQELLYVFGVPKPLASGLDLLTLGVSKIFPDFFGKFSFTDKDRQVSTTMINYWCVPAEPREQGSS